MAAGSHVGGLHRKPAPVPVLGTLTPGTPSQAPARHSSAGGPAMDATGFGRRSTAVALVLLPVVFLLGLATYGRLVQINSEDVAITLAMNRLRYAYLVMAPDLRPSFSTGYHDDERGLATTYMLGRSSVPTWPHFLVTTPTIVATVDAAVATAIVVLAGLAVEAPTGAVVAAAVVAFLVVWGALFSLQRLNLRVLRHSSTRFPTPPDER